MAANKWVIFKEIVREKLEAEEHKANLLKHQGIEIDTCEHKAEAYAEVLELLRELDRVDHCGRAA